jgi:hypothetical protein
MNRKSKKMPRGHFKAAALNTCIQTNAHNHVYPFKCRALHGYIDRKCLTTTFKYLVFLNEDMVFLIVKP